jgi:hypothetical protein
MRFLRAYRTEIGINWSQAFDISYLDVLEKAFQENSEQKKVSINRILGQEALFWKICQDS